MHMGEILNILYGDQYDSAYLTLFVMAFYPLNVVYGQMSAAIYYATERTGSYRNIMTALMILGMGVTYFALAPRHFVVAGLGAGAVGLAVKRVLVQFVAVNAMTYFNCRYLRTPFRPFLVHQLVAVMLLLVPLWAMRGGSITPVTEDVAANIRTVAVNAVLYAGFVVGLLVWKPGLLGLERSDLLSARRRILRY
jgi:hypothetical protein